MGKAVKTFYSKNFLPGYFADKNQETVYIHNTAPAMSREIQQHCNFALICMIYNNMINPNGLYLQLYFRHWDLHEYDNNYTSYYKSPLKDWLEALKDNDVQFERVVFHKRTGGEFHSRECKFNFVLKFKSQTDFNLARILMPSELSSITPKQKHSPFSNTKVWNNNKHPLITGKQIEEMVSRAKTKPKVELKKKKKAVV
jgi:hypothetical protein